MVAWHTSIVLNQERYITTRLPHVRSSIIQTA